ncbi:hypothetical protein V8E53_007458, partial [Lactarius tabidus]
ARHACVLFPFLSFFFSFFHLLVQYLTLSFIFYAPFVLFFFTSRDLRTARLGIFGVVGWRRGVWQALAGSVVYVCSAFIWT